MKLLLYNWNTTKIPNFLFLFLFFLQQLSYFSHAFRQELRQISSPKCWARAAEFEEFESEQALIVMHSQMILSIARAAGSSYYILQFIVKLLISYILIESNNITVKNWYLALDRWRWIN